MVAEPHLPFLLQVLSLTLALFGSFFGLLNAWNSWARDRVALKVVPKGYVPTAGGVVRHTVARTTDTPHSARVCVEVINLGYIPVTVKEIGFLLKFRTGHRAVITRFVPVDGVTLPYRLEARSAFTVYAEPDTEGKTPFSSITKAYAETECGVVATGSSPFLKNLIKLSQSVP